jgi:hypothetical protein
VKKKSKKPLNYTKGAFGKCKNKPVGKKGAKKHEK